MKSKSFVAATIASLLCLSVLAGGAQAEDHFLTGPVPVLADPLVASATGNFDMEQSDSGEAVAFWGENGGMFASRRPAGGSFGAPVLISTNGAGASLPQVSMTPSGHAVLVWRGDDNADNDQVYVSVKKAGESTFSSANQVSTESFPTPNVDPHVDVADGGTALVVWKANTIDGDNNSSRVRQRYVNTNGNVLGGGATTISPGSANGDQFPDVAVGPNGHALVTWTAGDSITGDPVTYWEGPNNATPDTQALGTNSGSGTVAAVDALGTAVIASKIGNTIIGNHREAGAGNNFLFDQQLEGAPGQVGYPEIGMDAAGKATVAFYAQAGDYRIRTADRPAGNSTLFDSTVLDAATSSADVNDLRLDVGTDGMAMITFSREDARFHSAVRDAGATVFGTDSGPISPAGIETGTAVPSVASNGKGIAAFSTETGGANKFQIDGLPYDDVPVASDLSVPSTAVQGLPVSFSVDPTDAWSAVTATEWTLDAGIVKSGNQVGHTYMTAGQRLVSVKLTDAMGNVTVTTAPIEITADKTAPVLSKFRILKRKAKAGRKNAFRFTLDDRAKVVISIKRISKGKGKRARGRIVKSGVAAGNRKIGFRGKVGKKKLKPARYKATAVAIDQFGNRSKPKKAGFRILGR